MRSVLIVAALAASIATLNAVSCFENGSMTYAWTNVRHLCEVVTDQASYFSMEGLHPSSSEREAEGERKEETGHICDKMDDETTQKVAIFSVVFSFVGVLLLSRSWRVRCMSVLCAFAVVRSTFDRDILSVWIVEHVDIGTWLSNVMGPPYVDMAKNVGYVLQKSMFDQFLPRITMAITFVYFVILAVHINGVLRGA